MSHRERGHDSVHSARATKWAVTTLARPPSQDPRQLKGVLVFSACVKKLRDYFLNAFSTKYWRARTVPWQQRRRYQDNGTHQSRREQIGKMAASPSRNPGNVAWVTSLYKILASEYGCRVLCNFTLLITYCYCKPDCLVLFPSCEWVC
ncbi:hypothetical protein BaRGS_00032413 [Batillaria attramentaria]|uniref:Uncharacterized protein n=1 Tax=Batillaria attramentaria TaxID=370345 RepID=A0ABD0JNF3_9CAEN